MAEFLEKVAVYFPFLASFAAFVVSIIFSFIHKKNAKTNGETATATAATLDVEKYARECIANAEKLYNYKVNGQSMGAQKKEAVLSKLRLYAVEKGYNVDETELSKMIDEFVNFMNTNKQK